ncbi:MAG: hypothetical protein IPN29_05425 [Saprospiraceae bacterium]|nr:hypothetical protein [Saprospiraceae bacterium]
MKYFRNFIELFAIAVAAIFIYSCAKDIDNKTLDKSSTQTPTQSRTRTPSNDNTTETATVLGRQRNNPYTITNMTLAFNTIYRTNLVALPVTHKYIKFLPTTGDHLAELQDWEINTLTPVFEFPLEYEVTTAGDYYVDPAVQDSAYTYRYASVPINVTLPNVPHQLISALFIPPINSYVAEQAFYQVGEIYEGDTSPHPTETEGNGGDGDDVEDDCHPGCDNYPCCKLGWNDCNEYPCGGDPIDPPCLPGSPNWPACLDVFPPPTGPDGDPDPDYCECTEYQQGQAVKTWKVQIGPGEDCSQFEQNWGVGSGVECTPGVSLPDPPELTNECGCPIPNNPNIPAGCIQVDTDGSPLPVKTVMVKLKDTWFSGDITFTNIHGCWRLNGSYSNNVWMWVQFQNSNCKVRAMRKWYVWQALVVADDYVDRFKHPPYNDIYVHYSNGAIDNESLARRYWACAHTINSDNEYRMGAGGDGIPAPRTRINYLLNAGNSTGGAPMLQGNIFSSWPQLLIAFGIGPVLPALTSPLYPDITNNYSQTDGAATYKGTHFHECGHASHHTLVGESYWTPYRNHIINNSLQPGVTGPYGNFGNFAIGSDPERVALGEALGNFTGFRYGSTGLGGEGGEWSFGFIPAGLMFDLGDTLVDIVTDPNPPLTPFKTGPDNISGFTPAMIFGALNPNVNSVRSFRNRLSTLSLGSTPNTLPAYNTFVDIYDVFN